MGININQNDTCLSTNLFDAFYNLNLEFYSDLTQKEVDESCIGVIINLSMVRDIDECTEYGKILLEYRYLNLFIVCLINDEAGNQLCNALQEITPFVTTEGSLLRLISLYIASFGDGALKIAEFLNYKESDVIGKTLQKDRVLRRKYILKRLLKIKEKVNEQIKPIMNA